MKFNEFLDSATSLRILVCLKLLLDEPEIYTRRQLADKLGVHVDTIKKYFKAMKYAGFDIKCSSYPDYLYYICNIEGLQYNNYNKSDMKLNKEFLTTFSSKRHTNDLFVTVSRTGRLSFSHKLRVTFDINTQNKVGLELKDNELFMTIDKLEDFQIKKAAGYIPSFYFNSVLLTNFLYNHFSQDLSKVNSFRLIAESVDNGIFRLVIKNSKQ